MVLATYKQMHDKTGFRELMLMTAGKRLTVAPDPSVTQMFRLRDIQQALVTHLQATGLCLSAAHTW